MSQFPQSLKPHATRAALAAALLAATASQAESFPAQSLIIPTQASYQDACGMVSVYGLVYSVLRADDGLRANPLLATGVWQTPITVHWVYNASKKSPNRCVPTGAINSLGVSSNVDVVLAGSKVVSGNPGITDATWNDGCDLRLDNIAGRPATLINNANTVPSADLAIVSNDTTTTLGKVLSFPNYTSKTVKVDATSSPNLDVTSLQYSGGAFVISSADAPAFLALLSGAIVTKDTGGHIIDFTDFKSNGTAVCNVGVSGIRAVFTGGAGGNASAQVHQVNIHRAQVPFTADDNQRMNSSPPRIGLLQSVDHDYADEGGVSVLTGLNRGQPDPTAPSGSVACTAANAATVCGPLVSTPICDTFRGACAGSCTADANCAALPSTPICDVGRAVCSAPIVGTPVGIKGTQLKYYLRSAGLDYAQAGGCYGYNVGYAGYTAANTLCPNGVASGQIYDSLDIIDVANNVINQVVTNTDGSTSPRYSVVWAPHWEGHSWRTDATTTGCDKTCLAAALTNISAYLSDTTKQHGFLAECASIGFLEGAVDAREATTYQTSCNPGYSNGDPVSSVTPGCYPNERFIIPTLGSQSLTCQQGVTPGSCSSVPVAGPPAPIGLVHDSGRASNRLDNCSDPTTPAGSACIHYPNPGSPFAQIGDFRWFSYFGSVSDYFPTSTTTYKPGYLPLAYTVGSLNAATLRTSARSLAIADNFSFIQREGDSRKAQMIYLGGHNYTADVAGTRVVLNTVLSLGSLIDRKESAFVGPTIYSSQVVLPTYFRNNSTGISVSWRVFDPAAGATWLFPYTTGNLRVHSVSTITTSAANSADPYGGTSLLYKAVLPAPGARNVFTYLGGKVSATDTELTGSFKAIYGNGVAQIGWLPVDLDYGSADPLSGCLDLYKIGPVAKGAKTYAGMVLGGNGVCDLQEALEMTITKADLGTDNGASEQAAIIAKLQTTQEIYNSQWLVQMVRGFCYATNTATVPPSPRYNPSLANCDAKNPVNTATLGGLVHSQAAVIPATTLVPDSPAGKHRPTVIYVGGLDGQLHAFYLPGDGLDNGYTGPAASAASLKTLNPTAGGALGVFHTKYGGAFSPPTTVTELWSFIPPGQLPYLRNNTARVDSSPAVADVFGDFNGSGVRTWHTVLVASAGGSNREIFALDITNPLQPILLWDLQSSFDSTQLAYAPAALQDDDTGLYTGSSSTTSARGQAFNWQNRCRAADATAGTCYAANYRLPPADDNCNAGKTVCGRTISSLYNYSRLGASQSVSVGTLRRNNAPVFSAFVATNEPGGSGISVFAIDMVSGAKLWEWDNPYDRESYKTTNPDKYLGTGNTPPTGVTVVSRSLDDQVNSLYVGDDEGSLWELDASDGINNTGYGVQLGCTPGTCNFPLSQAYGAGTYSAQPISTLSTLFVVRPEVPVGGLFKNYVGQTLLTYGTGGTDSVASISKPVAPSTVTVVSGAVHMLPLSPGLRDSAGDMLAESPSTTKRTHAATYGVAYELGITKSGTGTAFFPQYLTGGDRVFGSVVADLVTGKLYFGTTNGAVTDINARGKLSGNLYQLDTSVASTPISSIGKTGGIGGTLAMSFDTSGQATLVASTDAGLFVTKPTTGGFNASGTKTVYTLDGSNNGAQGLLGWILRRSGREQ